MAADSSSAAKNPAKLNKVLAKEYPDITKISIINLWDDCGNISLLASGIAAAAIQHADQPLHRAEEGVGQMGLRMPCRGLGRLLAELLPHFVQVIRAQFVQRVPRRPP